MACILEKSLKLVLLMTFVIAKSWTYPRHYQVSIPALVIWDCSYLPPPQAQRFFYFLECTVLKTREEIFSIRSKMGILAKILWIYWTIFCESSHYGLSLVVLRLGFIMQLNNMELLKSFLWHLFCVKFRGELSRKYCDGATWEGCIAFSKYLYLFYSSNYCVVKYVKLISFYCSTLFSSYLFRIIPLA